MRTASIALFLALTRLPDMLASGYDDELVIAWAGTIAALVIGAVLIVGGGRLERLLRDEDRAPDAPRAF